ncbi:hypothetical protein K788_00032095 [Paraburkholderia caribensis MBA4]|uniref:Uncharacterized protein n=1 Tax=Paraburkholderia caribensis MBA4 TaxID=1323664 RepID=A0A0N7JUY2_9BURK|nr:hypothetical protein K788_00032095 [Paraburkholderia caribensis MBA4]
MFLPKGLHTRETMGEAGSAFAPPGAAAKRVP